MVYKSYSWFLDVIILFLYAAMSRFMSGVAELCETWLMELEGASD